MTHRQKSKLPFVLLFKKFISGGKAGRAPNIIGHQQPITTQGFIVSLSMSFCFETLPPATCKLMSCWLQPFFNCPISLCEKWQQRKCQRRCSENDRLIACSEIGFPSKRFNMMYITNAEKNHDSHVEKVGFSIDKPVTVCYPAPMNSGRLIFTFGLPALWTK